MSSRDRACVISFIRMVPPGAEWQVPEGERLRSGDQAGSTYNKDQLIDGLNKC